MATSKYLVLYQIGGAGDKEVWRPGSMIELDQNKASIYLEAGLVRAIEVSTPPAAPVSDVVVHDVEDPATTPKAKVK